MEPRPHWGVPKWLAVPVALLLLYAFLGAAGLLLAAAFLMAYGSLRVAQRLSTPDTYVKAVWVAGGIWLFVAIAGLLLSFVHERFRLLTVVSIVAFALLSFLWPIFRR